MERNQQRAYEKMLEDIEKGEDEEYRAFLKYIGYSQYAAELGLPPTREQYDAWKANPSLQ